MIGGDQGKAGSVQLDRLQQQGLVIVDVIDVQKRENPWIGAIALEQDPQVGILELGGHYVRYLSARPLVEIAEHDPRPAKIGRAHQTGGDQLARLLSPLEEIGSQVNIEDVQHGAVDGDVGAQASALLPS